MSQPTASSLYQDQVQLSKEEPHSSGNPHLTKFCILCDTQYCIANDNAKNNWGDAVNFTYTDVKTFCEVMDLPVVHNREKIPLCPTCNMLIVKLMGFKDQVREAQLRHDQLQLQLTTRAIKTCRKYGYNEARAVNTTTQHVRRNIFKRWNKDIGDTAGPVFTGLVNHINERPPLLEPIKPESRRKSRLLPRASSSGGVLIQTAGTSPGVGNRPVVVAGPSRALPKPRPPSPPSPPPFRAQIRHKTVQQFQSPAVGPKESPEPKQNGIGQGFQLDDISIIEIHSGMDQVNVIKMDENVEILQTSNTSDRSEDQSMQNQAEAPIDLNQPEIPECPKENQKELTEDQNPAKIPEDENENQTEITEEDVNAPKIIKINQSIFEDSAEADGGEADGAEVNPDPEPEREEVNPPVMQNVIHDKAPPSGNESISKPEEENSPKKNSASETTESTKQTELDSTVAATPEKTAAATGSTSYSNTSPRVGTRTRKPTKRALESEEVMTLLTKRCRASGGNRISTGGGGKRKSNQSSTSSTKEQEQTKELEPEPEPEPNPPQPQSNPDPESENSEEESDSESKDGSNRGDVNGSSSSGTSGYMICETCDKIFKSKERFKEHMDMHAGQAPVCPICDKTFPRKYNLNIHLRTHTGEKPHLCSMCGAAYADKSNLNAHLRKHVDKPYSCSLCRKMYEQEKMAFKHVENVHPEENPVDIITTSQAFYEYDDE